MHTAFSILLAGIVTVHSVAGLCWQCAEMPAGCQESPGTATVCHCHRSSEESHRSEAAFQADSDCDFECTGTCRYLQSERPTVEQPTDMPWIAELPPEIGAIQSRSVFDVFERGALARGGHPPLRLHLVHGLLLI
ncbi:MAG: hypothetical protein JNK76_24535 [Planctomycetales bacterium]|nr:hypothetical protein [Planctomycetales bacterium]MBN8627005.1 hypothetical protein [Planctomycetota bacterium]